ncbi:Hypothetical predicted protein [Podarcis lilfordi]|uniref:Uncharacterized protein n=1 Tax=Podarcis lilfordi TaxID=74358 RepID=A0AA35KFS3_9SAUR|nr:Hypothetical predicted protein [Podarcis lilfordi]
MSSIVTRPLLSDLAENFGQTNYLNLMIVFGESVFLEIMKVQSSRLSRCLCRLRELLASCCRATKIHPLDHLEEDTVMVDRRKIRIHTIYVRPRDQGMDATSDSTSGSGNSEASSSS